jgi:uncharacterized protein
MIPSMPSSGSGAARSWRSAVLPFFAIAYAWTWTAWWSAAALGASVDDAAGGLLYMVGGLGPLVGALWFLRRSEPGYRRDFLRRATDQRRVAAPWWLATTAVAFGPAVVGFTVSGLSGTVATTPTYGAGAVMGVIAVAILAGVAEEPGWRGVAADHWQRLARPAWAAVGIGVLWALWHLPLAFVPGTYYHALGITSLELWLTKVALVQLGVLYVWLVNGGGGSVLLAVVAHAGFNVAVSLLPRSTVGDLSGLAVLTAATVLVVVGTRGRLGFAPNR